MKRKTSILAGAMLGGALLAAQPMASQAAVVISLDHVSVPPGSTAIVGVYASSNSNDVISGFNLPLDFNDDGYNTTFPTGFTFANPDLENIIYANTGLDMPQPQITLINVDAIPTGSGSNVQLSSTPTLLFDLAVNVASSVPVGTVVPLEIEAPAEPYSPLFNIAGPEDPTVNGPIIGSPVFGSITVVPEPSCVFLALAIGMAVSSSRSGRVQLRQT